MRRISSEVFIQNWRCFIFLISLYGQNLISVPFDLINMNKTDLGCAKPSIFVVKYKGKFEMCKYGGF